MAQDMLYFIQSQPKSSEGPMAQEVTRAEMFQHCRDYVAVHPDARLPLQLDETTFDIPAMYFRDDWPVSYGPGGHPRG